MVARVKEKENNLFNLEPCIYEARALATKPIA